MISIKNELNAVCLCWFIVFLIPHFAIFFPSPQLATLDPQGDLPHHDAAGNGHVDSLRLLLEAFPGGAQVKNKQGAAPELTVGPGWNQV